MGIVKKFTDWLNGDEDEDLDEEYENYRDDAADEDDYEEDKPSFFQRLKSRFVRSGNDDDEEEEAEQAAPEEPVADRRSNLSSANKILKAPASNNYRSQVAARETAYQSAVTRQANAAGTFSHTTTTAANTTYPQKQAFAPNTERNASLNAAANVPQKQFSVMKPTSFDDASSICDVLRNGKAIIVNFEGFSPAISQRIMDFVCGCIYAIDGQILQISGFIFIVAPKDMDITGDYTAFLQQDSFGVPTFRQ